MLLLDEPTRGIDIGAKAEVQSLVQQLADQGRAIVLISSELEDVVEGSTRVVVLNSGTVVGELALEEIDEHRIMDLMAATPSRKPVEPVNEVDRRRWRVELSLRTHGVYAALGLIIVFNLLFTPNFATLANLRLQLVQVTPVVIVALGMAVVVATGGIDLSVGAVMALAGRDPGGRARSRPVGRHRRRARRRSAGGRCSTGCSWASCGCNRSSRPSACSSPGADSR